MEPDELPGELLGIVYALRTEILHTCGDIAGTIEVAQRVLALLDSANLPVRASVYYSLGRAYYAAGDLERTLRVWSDFLPLCQEVKIYNMYAPIESMRCNILANLGKLQEATNLYQQAIAYMIANDIERFFIAGNVYNGLAMMAYQKNDLEQANQLATEGLKQNRPWGNLNAICVSMAYRAQVEIAHGDLDGAWADLQEIARIEQTYTPYFDARSIFWLVAGVSTLPKRIGLPSWTWFGKADCVAMIPLAFREAGPYDPMPGFAGPGKIHRGDSMLTTPG